MIVTVIRCVNNLKELFVEYLNATWELSRSPETDFLDIFVSECLWDMQKVLQKNAPLPSLYDRRLRADAAINIANKTNDPTLKSIIHRVKEEYILI